MFNKSTRDEARTQIVSYNQLNGGGPCKDVPYEDIFAKDWQWEISWENLLVKLLKLSFKVILDGSDSTVEKINQLFVEGSFCRFVD